MNIRKELIHFPILISVSIMMLTASCSKDSVSNWGASKGKLREMAIITVPNSSLRIDPLIFSSRVAQMKKGELVEILEKSKEMKNIGKSRNYWYKIKLNNGITGWTFGSLLKIIKDRGERDVKKYISEYWEQETGNLRKALHGKWWSVNRFGDFTNHSLELYDDGKYASYYKRSKRKIKGEYTFDFESNSIIFSNGTSFKENLDFITRGALYVLKKKTTKKNIIFKKINSDPKTENEKLKQKSKERKKKD